VRLGGQQRRVDVGGLFAVVWRSAELGAVGSLALAEQQVVRFPLDYLAWLQAYRSWMPTIFDGLAQTEDYARALIDLSPGITPEVAQARLTARMERQRRVLASVRSLVLLVDELALYFEVGDAAVMADQCASLLEIAAIPAVTLQVRPPKAHTSMTSGYLIADDAVWCEHVVSAGVYTAPETVMDIAARHDSLRAECYRASESLAVIRRAEELWRSGRSPLDGVLRLTAAATAGSASK
jgi:Domain of unknown function (DUF5753)